MAMNEIEKLFNPLIDAFDTFLQTDEKELGCLNEIEYERALADRNHYSQLLVEKLNGTMEQLVKENQQKTYPILLKSFKNDTDGLGNRKGKRRKTKECGV